MADRVLILGASARAAAASARRAGLTPFAIDLFADRDTAELCEYVLRVSPADYPRGLFDTARKLPPMPWLYTGGLENYPDLVGELARDRNLWGNDRPAIHAVRDQHALAVRMRRAGMDAVVSVRRPGGDGKWVRKPVRSSGGRGVRLATPDDAPEPDVCYQQYVPGNAMSVVFSDYAALATSYQLIGINWLHAKPFTYAGNLTAPMAIHAEDMGRVVTSLAEMHGLWGIDWIDRGGQPMLVEVNPRYTASIEIHELGFCGHLFGRFVPPPPPVQVFGKAIYYAPRQLTIPDSGPWDDSVKRCTDVWRRTDFADIPRPGEVIDAGQPVITILADAPTEASVLSTLKSQAAALDRLFGVPSPPDDSP